jgi:hypothetical protein
MLQKNISPQHCYRPRQKNVIQRLFQNSFARFKAVYEEQYADNYGKYRFTPSKFGELLM